MVTQNSGVKHDACSRAWGSSAAPLCRRSLECVRRCPQVPPACPGPLQDMLSSAGGMFVPALKDLQDCRNEKGFFEKIRVPLVQEHRGKIRC